MSFNTLNQYTGNHKAWDHVGNILPDIFVSEGTSPAVELMPASWLPVQFWDKHYDNWNVIMPGKLVALDQDGFVIPAEFAAGVASSTTVAYTSNDVAAGTIDIATGSAVTTAKTVTLTELTGAKGGSWTAATAGVSGASSASGFMGKFGVAWGPSHYPIGVLPYAALQHPGGDGINPADYKFHNYNMQHLITIVCDYVIKLPLVPAQAATETLTNSFTASAITFGTNDSWHNRTYVQATARYDATEGLYPCLTTYPVIAYPLDNIPVAKNTARTQFVATLTTLLVNEKSAMSAITQAGDYWVDYDVGVVFAYSADGATLPGAGTLTYYHYASAAATLSKFACILATTTELKPGDFLQCTTQSNWTRVATPGPASSTANFANVLGQVLGFVVEPRDLLERVRTAYTSLNTDSSGSMANGTAGSSTANLGQMDQMPGTATGGVGDLVHYAGAADRYAIVNLINR